MAEFLAEIPLLQKFKKKWAGRQPFEFLYRADASTRRVTVPDNRSSKRQNVEKTKVAEFFLQILLQKFGG